MSLLKVTLVTLKLKLTLKITQQNPHVLGIVKIPPGAVQIAERFRTDDDVGYIRLKFLRSFRKSRVKSSRTCEDPLPEVGISNRISIPTAMSSINSIDGDKDCGDYQRIDSNPNKCNGTS